MNDPLMYTTGTSLKVAFRAHCYGNGVDLVIVDMQHRILLRSALSYDHWGKFVSGQEAVKMATMHAPVLHELVDQALAPLDHKVQIVPVMESAASHDSHEAILQRVRDVLRSKWEQSLAGYFPDQDEIDALVTDVEAAIVGPSQPAPESPNDTTSSASVSIPPTDPDPIDYSIAPALVDVKGMHRHRFADNPEEKRFADAFDQDFGVERSNLRYLLRPASEQSTHALGFISDRDREVAATMVQWLGSSVGQGFLRDLGYTKRPLSPC